ncbi:MAG: OsmC family protein [Hyphomicrobiaceae bacterium]|nr:OsmC family protein [Hyphomicrobiaceae bacterium]
MTAEHKATVVWQRGEQPFLDKKYSRAHVWRFDDGCEVAGSCPPSKLIPVPLAKPDAVDPEEGLVASLSACQMLFFLALSAREGFRVDAYEDEATGVLGKNERGKTYMERITLRPKVTFSGDKKPSPEQIAALHERAHGECFIANTIRSEIVIDPPPPIMA